MRRIIPVILVICILSTFNLGCDIHEIRRQQRVKEINREWEAKIVNWEAAGRQLVSIKQSAVNRGYLTADELKVALSAIGKGPVTFSNGYWSLNPASREAYYLFVAAIIGGLLPFKALFYLSLERENYDDAELIRRNWSDCLEYLIGILESLAKDARYGDTLGRKHVSGLRYYEISLKDCAPALRKLQLQFEKLQIVGLTDPIQIGLRKELTIAIKEKKWDDAQKIQNLIASRVKELTARPQPRVVEGTAEKQVGTSSGGQTTVVVQQPSEQNIKIEQMPRYGATDIGRAISILDGKGGKLDPKAEGTLKLLDILLKR